MPDLPERHEDDAHEYIFELKMGRVRKLRHAACPPQLPWWRRWCPIQATGRVLWLVVEAVVHRLAGKP